MKDLVPIIIGLLALFQMYPVLRMLNAWLVDKTISGRLALFSMAIHICAILGLWGAGQFTYLLVYLSVTSLLWLLSPLLNHIGEAASMRRMRDDDMQRYQRMLAVDPRNAAAHSAIADIYLERGQLDDAIAAYQRAIEVSPDHTRREQYLLKHTQELRNRRGRRRVPLAPVETLADSLTVPRRAPVEPAPVEEAPLPEPAMTAPPDEEQPAAETWHWYDNLENNGK
ncbi:MAG: tetratricopeptide repeat protein [Armatimonadota bacterium]